MSNFDKHNLKHTSASQINMFSHCAGAWCARYLYGRKFTFGNAARAGVLAEDAVTLILTDALPMDEAIKKAQDSYRAVTVLTGTPSDIKRGEGIEGMIRNAVEVLTPYGKPDFTDVSDFNGQNEISLMCNGDGWSLPIKGFLDYLYPQHKKSVDLKTTMKMPSQMSVEHKRQGAIYKKATGMDVEFLYVTPKKSQVFTITDEDMDFHLIEIKNILNRQEKLLGLDAEFIKDIVPCNLNSFYWSQDKHVANELYGI